MVELNGTLLISILNFIILVAVLAHFCYKPVLKVMDDRRNKIRNDLDSAARSSAEAAKLKSDLEAELANAQVAAQGIVDKAVKEAKKTAPSPPMVTTMREILAERIRSGRIAANSAGVI